MPGKGYSLPEPIQLLNEELIRSQIGQGNVAVLPVIDSTNQYLLERIGELESGMPALQSTSRPGAAVAGVSGSHRLAQTSIFPCTGVLSRPAAAVGLSLVIGIVMAEVLHELGADKVRVKWPNDLYLNDRKLAGILVELTGKLAMRRKLSLVPVSIW